MAKPFADNMIGQSGGVHSNMVGRVISLLVFFGTFSAFAAETRPQHVLLVHSFGREFAPLAAVVEGFRSELARSHPGPVEFIETSLEMARFDGANREAPLVIFLSTFLAESAPDLVDAFGAPALDFARRNRAELFPDVPVLVAGAEKRRVGLPLNEPWLSSVHTDMDLKAMVTDIRSLLPRLRHLYVVSGTAPVDRFWDAEAKATWPGTLPGVTIHWSQSLAAAVARAYFSIIEASQQAANAREVLSLYEDYMKLTEDRKEQGFASEFDVSQIKAKAAGARDAINVAEAARAQAIRAIEIVTSRYPTGKLATRETFPRQPKSVPSGVPSQILERRPDIIAAERRFAASFHRANEARTARLPRFALSASNGLGTADLSGIGSIGAVNWNLAGGIIQPIFFGGELKAAEDIRNSEQKAAVSAYTATALRAFGDVEDALSNEYYLRQREINLTEMVKESANVAKLGRIQLEQGQTDMFVILRLVGENLAAKTQLTQVQASRLRERANLHLALGGDFKGTGLPSK